MVANLQNLAESIDKATIDRKVADRIESKIDDIKRDIQQQGYSLVTVEGKTFKVSGSR